MVTAAAENGASLAAIMQRTGHRSVEMVMRYVRPAQAFKADPLKGVL
jgi:Phage integrase family.